MSSHPPLQGFSACTRCGAPLSASGEPLCARCRNDAPRSYGHDAARIEPIALSAVLSAATPFFLEARDTLAFIRPGRAFAIELDYVAIVAGGLAVLLGAVSLALLRGTEASSRGRVLLGAVVACVAGIYELGAGLGLYGWPT